MKVKDLKQLVGAGVDPRDKESFLCCFHCGEVASANRGDYFFASPDSEITCCGQPMRRVRRVTRFVKA